MAKTAMLNVFLLDRSGKPEAIRILLTDDVDAVICS